MPRVSGARSSVPVSPAGCGRLGRSAIFPRVVYTRSERDANKRHYLAWLTGAYYVCLAA